jgi:hypothetical protein
MRRRGRISNELDGATCVPLTAGTASGDGPAGGAPANAAVGGFDVRRGGAAARSAALVMIERSCGSI